MNTPERRRTERILVPIRIRVIGNDMSGASFAEETVTVSFNQQGARISLIHTLLPDDVVLVKNLENNVEEEFRVVGAFQKVFGSRREWGVEALSAESAIWGVKFSSYDDATQPRVLVECLTCKTAAQCTLSTIEYDVLLSTGRISRYCDHCDETTRWMPSARPAMEEFQEQSQTRALEGGKELRRTRRLRLAMKLSVRNPEGGLEIAETRDVSKTGLCFISNLRYSVGDEVYITLPYAPSRFSVETKGRVIWLAEGAAGRFYGIEYLS